MLAVPPSGDKTGVTDWKNIQAAIDSLYGSASVMGAVELDGHYFVNGTIRSGDETGKRFTNPVAIIGRPFATISRVGAAADDYLLRMFAHVGSSVAEMAVTRLANLHFNCNHLCRGIIVSGMRYYPRFENLRIFQSVKSGLDAIACYCSSWSNIHVFCGRGYGARFGVFNSSSLDNMRIGRMNTDGADWPDDNDQVAMYEDGTPWNAAAAQGKMQHAAMYLDGNCFEARNLAFEGNKCMDDTCLQLAASSSRISTLRFENNVATRCKVRIAWTAYTQRGHYNRVDNLYVRDTGSCKQIVEYTGNTSHNVVDGVNVT